MEPPERRTRVTTTQPSTAAAVAPSRLVFLDALRGIAAMWVVIFHFGEDGRLRALQSAIPAWLNTAVFTAGHFGVPIFFVLSGFVITYAIGDDRVDARYFGRFALRRSIRLDLPYWASIALCLAYAAVKARLQPEPGVHVATVTDVVAHMLYLQDFLGLPRINWVYWTLSFEIQFYLMFCALLGVAHRLRRSADDRRPQHIVFMSAAIVSLVWPLIPALHLRGLALPNWHGFLLGAFACWALRGTIRPRWFGLYAALVCGVWGITRDSFTIVCVITATIIFLTGKAGHLGTWLGARWLQFLGRVSYSLYLIHIPVSGAAFFVIGRFLGKSPAQDVIAMFLAIVVNCVAAQIFWWLIERPSTSLARRVRKS
jgi:peptidoglycan/LPS O-acetylase OafA/YrhL